MINPPGAGPRGRKILRFVFLARVVHNQPKKNNKITFNRQIERELYYEHIISHYVLYLVKDEITWVALL